MRFAQLRRLQIRRGARPWARWQRIAVGIVSLPTLFVSLVAAGFYLNVHRNAAAMSMHLLPIAPAPAPPQRLLVLAPHCDDETLGVGGIIAEARQRGVPVTVAFFTNGDGFRLAASVNLRRVSPGPVDYIRFGERRQSEAIRALAELGIAEQDIVFLGYPDQGLMGLWETSFGPDHLQRSPFTGATRSPFRRCYTAQAPYCGASVVADLCRLMEQVRPTDIYVTHPADDHADHCAAPAFTQAALERLRAARHPWAETIGMHYYLIHRGDWPLPQGYYPDHSLLPPQGMMNLDTTWSAVPLSPDARAAKERALAHYRSQVEVMSRLLNSFLRANEFFGDVPEPQLVDGGAGTVLRDAAGDDLARFANPGADLLETSVVRHGDRLRIQVSARGPVSPGVAYTVRVRGQADGGGATSSTTRVPTAPSLTSGSRTLTSDIPLSEIGLEGGGGTAWICADTRVAPRIPVDRTGWREVRIRASAERVP